MRREGWIYGLAFAAILGIGAWFIVPRLLRLRDAGTPTTPPPRTAPEPDVAPTPDPPARTWVRVRVRGPQGALVGPMKPVLGAEVRRDEEDAGGVEDFRLRPTADEVHFGASGHQWKTVPAADIVHGTVVTLPEAGAPVIVRVREMDDRPAAGVPVRCVPASPGPVRRTGRGGAVVIDDAAEGLLIVGVGGSERAGPILRLVVGRDRDVKAVLEPAWTVRGRVLDAEGGPAEGVRVEGIGARGLVGVSPPTDEQGRFAWMGPVEAALSMRLTLPGRGLATVEVLPPARGPLTNDLGDIRLRGGSTTLEGRILAATPMGEARVFVEPAVTAILRELFGPRAVLDAPHTVVPDGDGRFQVPDVPAGMPLRVSVRGAGLDVDDVVVSEADGGVLELPPYAPPPGHLLEGRVIVGADRTPRPGVRLLVSSDPGDGPVPLPFDRLAVTDGAGRFRVAGLPAGDVFVRAYVPGFRPLLQRVSLPRIAPAVLALDDSTADPSRRVEGVVADHYNVPLEGVTVRAAGQAARTNAKGRFRLDDVEGFGEEVLLTAAYEAGPPPASGSDPAIYVRGLRRAVTPGGEPVTLVLAAGASLKFRAIDGIDDEPLSFVRVLLRTEAGEVIVDRDVATANGEVRLAGLLPRGGTLSVFSRKHRHITPVMLRPARTTDLGTLRLARGIHVTGRVVNAAGEPIAGAFLGGVEPTWLGAGNRDVARSREIDLRRAVTAEDGTFVFDGFDPKKPAVLAVWAPGYAPAARRVVLEKFKENVHVAVTVRLQRGGWLAVELREEDSDRPISGALFDMEDARNGSDFLDLLRRGMLSGPVGCDDDWRRASEHFLVERDVGHYRVGPAEPGPYEVLVSRPGYESLRRKLTILDPTNALVDVSEGTSRPVTESLHLTWELIPR